MACKVLLRRFQSSRRTGATKCCCGDLGLNCASRTNWSPSGNGSGRRSTASMAENTAELAPMASASVSTTAAVKTGVLRSERAPRLRLRTNDSGMNPPWPRLDGAGTKPIAEKRARRQAPLASLQFRTLMPYNRIADADSDFGCAGAGSGRGRGVMPGAGLLHSGCVSSLLPGASRARCRPALPFPGPRNRQDRAADFDGHGGPGSGGLAASAHRRPSDFDRWAQRGFPRPSPFPPSAPDLVRDFPAPVCRPAASVRAVRVSLTILYCKENSYDEENHCRYAEHRDSGHPDRGRFVRYLEGGLLQRTGVLQDWLLLPQPSSREVARSGAGELPAPTPPRISSAGAARAGRWHPSWRGGLPRKPALPAFRPSGNPGRSIPRRHIRLRRRQFPMRFRAEWS